MNSFQVSEPTENAGAVRSATESSGTRDGRIFQLDVLRGVAILLVLGHHVVIKPDDAGRFGAFAIVWQRFGWTGVDLFFVLSGFLIGGLLFKELRTTGRLDVGRFLIRRGLKIWPSYFAYLAGLALYMYYCSGEKVSSVVHQMIPNVLQVQNYFWSVRGHLWSLAVEEHFYLALPFLVLWLSRNRGSQRRLSLLPFIAAGLVLACLSLRCLGLGHPYDSNHYNYTHLRIDSLFWGVLMAYLYFYNQEGLKFLTRNRAVTFVIGLALLTPMMILNFDHPFVWTIGYTCLYIGYSLILIAFINIPLRADAARKHITLWPLAALGYIGYYSYTIYLWHMDAGRYRMESLLKRGFLHGVDPSLLWAITMTLYVGLAVLAGVITARLIEKPVLLVRDRLFPGRSRILGTPAVPEAESRLANTPIPLPAGERTCLKTIQ